MKIVCLGGGNAMPRAVLAGLKKKKVEITAVCAMLDTGGSSGRLRRDYGIVAPGDIRRAFIALANTSPVIEDLFNFRFETGQLKGHNFANLFITALELSTGNYQQAFQELNKILNLKHKVLPVTLDNSEIYAVLENKQKIKGEKNIDVPKHDSSLKITKVFLKPTPQLYPPVSKEIKSADLIVIGPGDLYSSLAQILLVDGLRSSIKKSRAKLVYLVNTMTKRGETNDYTVEDFTSQVENWLDHSIDYVLYNNQKVSTACLNKYLRRHPELIHVVKKQDNKSKKYIGFDALQEKSLSHDPAKVSAMIMKICKQLS